MKLYTFYLPALLILFPLLVKGQITVGDSTSSGVTFYPLYQHSPASFATYTVDIDNNGSADIKVETSVYLTFGGAIYNYQSSITNLNSVEFVATSTYTNWVDTMHVGNLIDAGLNWQSSGTGFWIRAYSGPGSPSPYSYGIVKTTANSNNFIGFRMASKNIYGWLNVTPHYQNPTYLDGITLKSYAVTGLQTGIKETDREHSLTLYPNPANSGLYFRLPQQVNITGISIKNTLGGEMSITDYNPNDVFIGTSHLPNGVYFIELDTEKGRFSQKFFVNH